MNRRPSGQIPLAEGIQGFLQFKIAEGLSPRSIESYQQHLRIFLEQVGNVPITTINSSDIAQYLAWLREDYKPTRFSGVTDPISKKTLRNHWVTLSSLFGWYAREFEGFNPVKKIPPPKFEKTQVEPFSKVEVEALLKACIYTKEASTHFRRSFSMRRATANRDKSILLTLLDTGLRASEFCSLKIGDFEIETGKLEIKPGQQGGAKGGKGRIVYLGKTARKALWRYLIEREDKEFPDAPLCLSTGGRKYTPNALGHLVRSLGKRAQVSNCFPHRFRHTFAITYLRSGGDIFTLQSLLGHRSLEMVQHYARVAQIDLQQAHRKASPVDNWRL